MFAPHIHLTTNSHYEKCQPLFRVLCLALIAVCLVITSMVDCWITSSPQVDFAFLAYRLGKYVILTKKFDQQGVGYISN